MNLNTRQPYLVNQPLGRLKKYVGFSLLEILVAFSILAISLTIILKIFSSGLQTAYLAKNYSHAIAIAESLLAKTGVEEKLELGETHGQESEYFNWVVQITPIDLNMSSQIPDAFKDRVVQIKVTVSWGDHNPRSIHLTTVKLMPANEINEKMPNLR